MSIRVVNASFFLSGRKLLSHVLLCFVVVPALVVPGVLFGFGITVILLVLLAIHQCQHVRTPQIAAGLGVVTGSLSAAAARLFGIITITGDRLHWISGVFLAAAVGAFVYLFLWYLIRGMMGSPVVQDGTLCAKCGYCLRGCSNQRCPECGTAFEDFAAFDAPPMQLTGRE